MARKTALIRVFQVTDRIEYIEAVVYFVMANNVMDIKGHIKQFPKLTDFHTIVDDISNLKTWGVLLVDEVTRHEILSIHGLAGFIETKHPRTDN